MLTHCFENGLVTWRDRDGHEFPGRRIVVGGKILGSGALESLR